MLTFVRLKLIWAIALCLVSGNLLAWKCEHDIDLETITFKETIPNQFVGKNRYNDQLPAIKAEIIQIGPTSRLRIVGQDKKGECLLEDIDLEALKICPSGQWSFRGKAPLWSIVSKSALLKMDDSVVAERSSICGLVTVKGLSKIVDSIIHNNEPTDDLEIETSSLTNVTLLRPTKSTAIRGDSSSITASNLWNVKINGGVKANGLSLSYADYNLRGDLTCDKNRCYYVENPCSAESKNVYSFIPFLPFKIWHEANGNFFYEMARRDFSCQQSVANRPDFTFYMGEGRPPWKLSEGTDGIDSQWPSPEIKYVGCTYDGKISKSLFEYNIDSPPDGDIYRNYSNINAVCSETLNPIQDNISLNFAAYHTEIETIQKNYFTLKAAPYCYKYRLFQTTQDHTYRELQPVGVKSTTEGFELKYEECSDCGIGKVKTPMGTCTCPPGYQDVGGKCKRDAKCETIQEFSNGDCSCTKPYLVLDAFGKETYSCIPPTHDWLFPGWNPDLKEDMVTDYSLGPCYKTSGGMKFPISITIDASKYSEVDAYLFCVGKRSQFLTSRSHIYGRVGRITTQNPTLNINMNFVGDCYEFEVRLGTEPFWWYYWKKEISINYSECKNEIVTN